MKTIVLVLMLLPLGLMGQEQIFASSKKVEKMKVSLTPEIVSTPFASASITITITDSGSATLADIRDALCAKWGYTGAANDNAAKLAFLKQFLINKISDDYLDYKGKAALSTTQITLSTQINIQ